MSLPHTGHGFSSLLLYISRNDSKSKHRTCSQLRARTGTRRRVSVSGSSSEKGNASVSTTTSSSSLRSSDTNARFSSSSLGAATAAKRATSCETVVSEKR